MYARPANSLMGPDVMSDISDVCAAAPDRFAIRPAQPADVPTVLAFVHKLAEYEPSIAFYQQLGAKPFDSWHVYRLSGAALDALGGRSAPWRPIRI